MFFVPGNQLTWHPFLRALRHAVDLLRDHRTIRASVCLRRLYQEGHAARSLESAGAGNRLHICVPDDIGDSVRHISNALSAAVALHHSPKTHDEPKRHASARSPISRVGIPPPRTPDITDGRHPILHRYPEPEHRQPLHQSGHEWLAARSRLLAASRSTAHHAHRASRRPATVSLVQKQRAG